MQELESLLFVGVVAFSQQGIDLFPAAVPSCVEGGADEPSCGEGCFVLVDLEGQEVCIGKALDGPLVSFVSAFLFDEDGQRFVFEVEAEFEFEGGVGRVCGGDGEGEGIEDVVVFFPGGEGVTALGDGASPGELVACPAVGSAGQEHGPGFVGACGAQDVKEQLDLDGVTGFGAFGFVVPDADEFDAIGEVDLAGAPACVGHGRFFVKEVGREFGGSGGGFGGGSGVWFGRCGKGRGAGEYDEGECQKDGGEEDRRGHESTSWTFVVVCDDASRGFGRRAESVPRVGLGVEDFFAVRSLGRCVFGTGGRSVGCVRLGGGG